MHIGWREEKEQRQARAPTQQGMDAIATQERARMVRGGMPYPRIGITPPPGEDGSAIDDEVTR